MGLSGSDRTRHWLSNNGARRSFIAFWHETRHEVGVVAAVRADHLKRDKREIRQIERARYYWSSSTLTWRTQGRGRPSNDTMPCLQVKGKLLGGGSGEVLREKKHGARYAETADVWERLGKT